MVVIALIAIAVGLTTLSLRDPTRDQLEREAVRLAALLEMARADARTSAMPVQWSPRPQDDGRAAAGQQFHFAGLSPATQLPERWLDARVQAQVLGAARVVLGPEPLLPAQRIVLSLEQHRIEVASDGLTAFAPVLGSAVSPP